MDGTSVSMKNIVLWDTETVCNFLNKNRVFGCSSVIKDNNIDGIAFLNLDLVSLNSMGLTFMEQCKINALLNSIASEASRKEFASKWSQPPKKERKILNNDRHIDMKPLAISNATPSHPPVPRKPQHLRLAQLAPSSSPAEKMLEPANRTHTSGMIRKISNDLEEEGYERLIESSWDPATYLKPVNKGVLAPFATENWLDDDSFSSDEFSDCDEDERKSRNPESVFVAQESRQPDPLSTPPPLPNRNVDTNPSSSSSLNVDRSESLLPGRKFSLPAPPSAPPPPPPGRRAQSTSCTPVNASRSPRDQSPMLEKPVQRATMNDTDLMNPWYFKVGRKDAERSLQQCVEGAFLIRPTEHGAQDHRYTMSIIFNRRIFHIPVRQKPNGRWALGSEKVDEETFRSVEELVEEHRNKPINLHTDGRLVGTTCLVIWPSKQSF